VNTAFTESTVEQAALTWLSELGWQVKHGSEIAPDGLFAERRDFGQVVLEQRLRDALARLNPTLPAEALEDAYRKLTRPEGEDLLQRNRALHRLLIEGIPVEYLQPSPRPDGHPSPTGRGDEGEGLRRWGIARVIDFEDPGANDWLAVNQFAVVENRHSRQPDIVLFVNGLPLAVIELKNAAEADATIWTAWQQLQTCQSEIPSLFAPNTVLVVSDGLEARVGSLGAGREWFKPWRTIGGETVASEAIPQLQIVLEGLFDKRRFLDLVRDFIVFEDDGSGRLVKKVAGYHQFHTVRVAVEETLRAAALQRESLALHEPSCGYAARKQPGGQTGDRRSGVVWHTQGSGKSLTMAFYAGRIIRELAMENPTLSHHLQPETAPAVEISSPSWPLEPV
jgi:type I restriction enzyme R subunit